MQMMLHLLRSDPNVFLCSFINYYLLLMRIRFKESAGIQTQVCHKSYSPFLEKALSVGFAIWSSQV